MLQGALRIHYAQPGKPIAPSTGTPPPDDYTAQLAKLFPAEIVSIYSLGLTLLNPDHATGINPSQWWFTLMCAVLIIALRVIATKPKGGGATRYVAVAISVVSFLLWAVSLGGWFLPGAIPEGARLTASLLALGWTLIAPGIAARFP